MDRQTLRDWVHRYNAEGLSGLYDRPRAALGPRSSSRSPTPMRCSATSTRSVAASLPARGKRAGYRAISNRKVGRGYGRWLTWLDGLVLLEEAVSADRITRERVAEYVRALQALGNASQTIERPWPEPLAVALDEWWRRWRPVLSVLKSRWTRPIGEAL